MIRAALRYAEGKGPPPPELIKYLKWKTWGVLPKFGGTDDQRAGELERMTEAGNTFEFWRAYLKGKLPLRTMTPEQLQTLRKLKVEHGEI